MRLIQVIFRPTFHPQVSVMITRSEEYAVVERVAVINGALSQASARAASAEVDVLPPFPDGDVDLAARDGIVILATELDTGGERSVRASSPSRQESPAHHAFFVAVLALAARHLADDVSARLFRDVQSYL